MRQKNAYRKEGRVDKHKAEERDFFVKQGEGQTTIFSKKGKGKNGGLTGEGGIPTLFPEVGGLVGKRGEI